MIQNVIFDVGNVFVRWSPAEVVERCFGLSRDSYGNAVQVKTLFKSPIWYAINRGELTRVQAEVKYSTVHHLSVAESTALFRHAMDHQVPIEGTRELAGSLKAAGYRLFGLTDNVREIVAHLKRRYDFWPLFEGAVVSAEVGLLKPDRRIFEHLLATYRLAAEATVFVDDVLANVEGARSVGMAGVVFETAAQCATDLRSLRLEF